MTPPEVDYRVIQLTKDQVTYVSPHRYEWLMQWKWYAYWNKRGHCFYAARCGRARDGEPDRVMFMHRQIKGLNFGDPREVDHANNKQTLDNTDTNLRFADRSQQMCNQGLRSDNTTGYKWGYRHSGRYRAVVVIRGKRHELGFFDDPALGHQAAWDLAQELHKEYARSQ